MTNPFLLKDIKNLPARTECIFRISGGSLFRQYTKQNPYTTRGILIKKKNSLGRAFFPFVGELETPGSAFWTDYGRCPDPSVQEDGWILIHDNGHFVIEETTISIEPIFGYRFQ